ncbi:MAG: hypothetical protein EXR27_05805 [Betaproteobacteria bacterium]|nr:hypothetical protein [Betaproteobacteria bacterium]
MPNTPAVSPEERARRRQRQLEELALKASYQETDGVVEAVSHAAVLGALWAHVALVALGAWLVTRGGSLIGTAGAACLLFDAILCMFTLVSMVRIALENTALRGVLIATSATVALAAIPTVLASVFGKLNGLPFEPIYLGGGILIITVLVFLACYGAVSAWLTWLLGFHSADHIRKHKLFRASP